MRCVSWFLLLASLLPLLTAQRSAKEQQEQQPSGVWLGNPPICRSQSGICAALDMLFERADAAGDASGGGCWTGQKVLCSFRPLSRRLATSRPASLTLVTYNVFARPYLVSHDGQRERTCRIPRALLTEVPSADVIVFQEAFLPGCLSNNQALDLRGVLRNYGFEYSTRTVGTRRWGLRINGGVFIASKWPIEKQAQMVFRQAHPGSADSLANKGVVHAQINKLGTVYHVFGTHLQAEDGPEFDRYRELQAVELADFVRSRGVPASEPVIIAGDFNADRLANRGHVARLLAGMNATLPPIGGHVRATYDPAQNDVVEAGITARQWLDYAVYSSGHRAPTAAHLRAVQLLADPPVDFCVAAPLQPAYVAPESGGCSRKASRRHLSDHFPVVAEFRFD